ncbi:MAG TPA: hypothetical protein DCZ01_00415 [Elusimicrobia bacterium]|nr:MAG: hypothetical protein A2X37_05310 [Elusimicrobia bacterium GWA2_66_18]HAZ06996.1 hypothetical protein [Elusimicrobiota bacterium]
MRGTGVLVLTLAYDCQQSCVFCSENEGLAGRHPSLGLEETLRILLVKRREGVKTVFIGGGGEPTLNLHFPKIVEAAKRLGMRLCVISNGLRFADAAFAGRVLPWIDEIVFSLHGDTADVHERVTGTPGSFTRVAAAFRNAAAGARALASMTVATRLNWDQIDRIVCRSLGESGARTCYLSSLSPEGRAGEKYEELVVPLAEWRRRLPSLAALAASLGGVLKTRLLPRCVLGDPRMDFSIPAAHVVYRSLVNGRSELVDCLELETHDQKGQVKTARCADCPHAAACSGMFARYVEAFGDADLGIVAA